MGQPEAGLFHRRLTSPDLRCPLPRPADAEFPATWVRLNHRRWVGCPQGESLVGNVPGAASGQRIGAAVALTKLPDSWPSWRRPPTEPPLSGSPAAQQDGSAGSSQDGSVSFSQDGSAGSAPEFPPLIVGKIGDRAIIENLDEKV